MPLASRLSVAILAACSITLALLCSYAFHLERPYWAGIAAMVLSFSAQGQSLQKGLWRIAGTVVGAVAGMAAMAYFGESLTSLLIACAVILALLVMLMDGSRYSYFYYSSALMLVLVLAQSREEAPFAIASARMEENLVGIAAYTFCALCLRPHAASEELHELRGFGQGLLGEWREAAVPEVFCRKAASSADAVAALALITLVWQEVSPPGTESTLYVEIASLLVLIRAMTGHFAAWELLPATTAGIAAAFVLYSAVIPSLSGPAGLGTLVFVLSFGMAWVLPAPEQSMARMGALMPVLILSGLGGETFSPQDMLGGAAALFCSALSVSLLYYFFSRPAGRF